MHPDVGIYLSNLAGLRVSQEDWADAVTLLKRGTDIAIRASKRASDGQARTGQTASDARRPSDKLSLLVKAAARLAAEQARQEPELAGAMFETAQWALSSKAATSLAQMAARQAKGDSALAALCASDKTSWANGRRATSSRWPLSAQSPEARRHGRAGARDRIATIDMRIAEIDKTLAKFPDY